MWPPNPCLDFNCGEAGCLVNPSGDPECMCIDGKSNLKKTDANLKCNWTITAPVDTDGMVEDPNTIGESSALVIWPIL